MTLKFRTLLPLLVCVASSVDAQCLLESNEKNDPQDLDDILPNDSPSPCAGQGRTDKCEVLLDVPSQCVDVATCTTSCPIVFFLHGAGGSNNGFPNNSNVHRDGFIGVYPQGENGWNTGPKNNNDCLWNDFECDSDPDEGMFIADIIKNLGSDLGMNGNVYLNGNSNGAALAHRIAVNAGSIFDYTGQANPIKGIITKVTQLLESPDRSGPGNFNYNNPAAKGGGPKISVLNVMGVADNLIPYEGGSSSVFGGVEEFQLMSATGSMSEWAIHNDCSPFGLNESIVIDKGDGTGTFMHWVCSGESESIILEHYGFNGVGHNAGGTKVNGVSVGDLATAFINRCEATSSPPSPTTTPPVMAPTTSTPVEPTTLSPVASNPLCGEDCEDEWPNCVNFHNSRGDDGCNICSQELETPDSTLVNRGNCVVGCTLTEFMLDICPNPTTTSPTKSPTPKPTTTCRSLGKFGKIKKFCKNAGKVDNDDNDNSNSFYEIDTDIPKDELYAQKCVSEECTANDCCLIGRDRNCSNTDHNGKEKKFKGGKCDDGWKRHKNKDLKNFVCTGENGYKCTSEDCCYEKQSI